MAPGEADVASFSGEAGSVLGFTTKKDYSENINSANPVTAAVPIAARRRLLQTAVRSPTHTHTKAHARMLDDGELCRPSKQSAFSVVIVVSDYAAYLS
eukprot:1077115-Prorocentrum_minimum.AAC.4